MQTKWSTLARKLVKVAYIRAKRTFALNMYNDFTIAQFFRGQGAQIGVDNRIEIRSLGPEPYLIRIGNHCTIGPDVKFLVHDGGTWIFTEEIPSLQKFAPIWIMDNCFIGQSAIVLPGVTIGPNSIVGAGSVVTRDVPSGTIAVGNPARAISSVEEYRQKVVESWKQQKPSEYFQGIKDGAKYSPEYIQIIKTRDAHLLKKHLLRLFPTAGIQA